MNRLKRTLAVLISIIMMAALFASCGDVQESDSSSAVTSQASETTKVAETKPPEKIKLLWTGYLTKPYSDDAVSIKKIEEKFNVDFELFNIENNNYEEQLNLKISSGEVPDSIRLAGPQKLQTFFEQGVIKEMNRDLLKTNAPFIVDSIDKNFKDYWSLGTLDGKLWGVPTINSTNIFRLPIIYNKNWMDKLGYTKTPETLEEFEKLIYDFAKKDPDGNGKKDTYGLSADGLRMLFGAFGLNPGTPDSIKEKTYFHLEDGKVVYDATDPDLKQALTYAAKWYKDGVLDPEFITGENTGGYWPLSHSFINGRVGFTVRGNFYHWAMPGSFKELNDKAEWVDNTAGAVAKEIITKNPDAKLVFGQPVKGPSGQQGVKGFNLLMDFYCVGANVTPEKEAKIYEIWNFLGYRFAQGDQVEKLEQYLTWRYGPEGDYWKWTDKTKAMYMLTEKFKTEFPDDSPVDKYGPDTISPEVPYTPQLPIHEWAYKEGFNKGGLFSVIQFGLPAMSTYDANLFQIRNSGIIDMITGKKPIDYFDQYVKDMNTAGAEQIVKEANEWYQKTQK